MAPSNFMIPANFLTVTKLDGPQMHENLQINMTEDQVHLTNQIIKLQHINSSTFANYKYHRLKR